MSPPKEVLLLVGWPEATDTPFQNQFRFYLKNRDIQTNGPTTLIPILNRNYKSSGSYKVVHWVWSFEVSFLSGAVRKGVDGGKQNPGKDDG